LTVSRAQAEDDRHTAAGPAPDRDCVDLHPPLAPADGLTRTNAPANLEKLSIVIPLHNEAENVQPLVTQVRSAMTEFPIAWEAIFVDDGSSDDTLARLVDAAEQDHNISIIELQRNFGQTAAMQAGIDAASGTIIATLDGDLQNDPSDVPRLVHRLINEDLDLVSGWRVSRTDGFWLRRLPSLAANALIGRVTGVRLHDYGCSLKVYRSSILKQVRLYGEMHRFIPTWVATQTSPRRIKEEPVAHRPRRHGRSKYGISRTVRVLPDLLSMYFFLRFRAMPGHFFGRIGLLFGAVGGGILVWLTGLKLFLGESVGGRPLLLLGVMLVIAAIQFLTTGVLAEQLTRTYYESSNGRSYRIRSVWPRTNARLGAFASRHAIGAPGDATAPSKDLQDE
jgi:glycosyltransferase involved in cell wall biosynthesis